MKKYAIIVAGGKGVRMGNDIPKQFLELCGKPLLMHSIERFFAYDNAISILVVLPQFQIDFWEGLCKKHRFIIPHIIIQGGDERYYSVKNGVDAISDSDSIVAIHDGVRPLVSNATIERCFAVALEKGNAIPSIGVVDSVRIEHLDKNEVVDRNKLRLIQTPQTFQTKILKDAYNQDWHSGLTDDATVIESFGYSINLVEGNRENIKVTSPIDLKLAELFLAVE